MTDGGRAARAIWKIGPGQKDPRSNEQWSGQRRDTTDGYFNFALGDPPLAVSPLPLSLSHLSLPFTIPPFLESRVKTSASTAAAGYVQGLQGTLCSSPASKGERVLSYEIYDQ